MTVNEEKKKVIISINEESEPNSNIGVIVLSQKLHSHKILMNF